MAVADLTNTGSGFMFGKDDIVIRDKFEEIRGGRTLDVTGYPETAIKAGHVIIQNGSTFKPMPVTGLGEIKTLGTITGGSLYTDGTYEGVALTGGSGTGATADIVVASGAVTTVTIVADGKNYVAGDELSAAVADIGETGSGFKVVVATVGLVNDEYDALPSGYSYAGINIFTIPTTRPMAGILVRGSVNPNAVPFDMTAILDAVKTALPLVTFLTD
jgi:hypothetical protein